MPTGADYSGVMIRFVAFVLFLAVLVATLSPHHASTTGNFDVELGDGTPAATGSSVESGPAVAASSSSTFAGTRELVLDRAPDGHFYTDAQVGPATIHFLIDTGASTIALSPADAQAAGVQYAASDRTGVARTAGGDVGLKRVTLDRVAIGPFDTRDVDAAVIDTPMKISLLGQSWLRKVGTVTISGDKMVLR